MASHSDTCISFIKCNLKKKKLIVVTWMRRLLLEIRSYPKYILRKKKMCHRNICHFFILNSLNKRLVWLDVSQKRNISPWFSHKDSGLDQISGGQTDEHRTAESTDDGTDGKWILSWITHARARSTPLQLFQSCEPNSTSLDRGIRPPTLLSTGRSKNVCQVARMCWQMFRFQL